MLITWLIRKTVTQSQNSEKPSKTMLGILFVTYFCYVGIQFVPNPLIFLKECKKECFPKNSKLVQVTKNKWQLTSSCVIFDICHIVFLNDFVSFKSPVKHKTSDACSQLVTPCICQNKKYLHTVSNFWKNIWIGRYCMCHH